jgi:hypothetical protein
MITFIKKMSLNFNNLGTINRFYFILIVLFGLSFNAFSQLIVTGGADVQATIVEPVNISKTVNSEFGNVAVILAGTVEMAPAGSHVEPGNIVLPVATGTFTAAIYCFSGASGYTYTVSYPTSPLTIKGSKPLKVAAFLSDPVPAPGSNLIAGVFVAVTPSNVTVNYN